MKRSANSRLYGSPPTDPIFKMLRARLSLVERRLMSWRSDQERKRDLKTLRRHCRFLKRWPTRDLVHPQRRGRFELIGNVGYSLERRGRCGAARCARDAPVGLASATKRFGGVIAIRDVTFDLAVGEVLALLGENGAGKSTCVKLLAGVCRPDAGAVLIDRRPAESWSPLEASRCGIAVMHQRPGLFGDLSVYENIFLGHIPRNRLGGVDDDRMRRRTSELLDVVGLDCSPRRLLKELRTSEQQLVEIVRALSVDARVLIMDEPTAALSHREVKRIFGVVSGLKTHGVAMMFVSHRMEEIYRVADRIAVMRDGRLIGIGPTGEIGRDEAVRMLAAP
jgi:ABC-type sugar transport system ATPase subunit